MGSGDQSLCSQPVGGTPVCKSEMSTFLMDVLMNRAPAHPFAAVID
jgi:hypothetical protein